MSEMTIEVQRREETGKNANRRLRRSGFLPAVLYGGKADSVAIQVKQQTLHSLLKNQGGENAVFLLKLTGSKDSRHAMVRRVEIHPITRRIQHLDFQRIDLSQKVKVQVHVELLGEPIGVTTEEGVLDFITREIEVECLPTDIPAKLEIDVSELHLGQHLEIKDLETPPGVEITDDPSRVLLSVSQSRVAAELEAEEATEEEELIESESEEPEVIGGKGKEEEEGEEPPA